MKMQNQSKHIDWLIKSAILTGICISLYLIYYRIFPALGKILSFIAPVLLPFILAIVIAVLIDPVVSYLNIRLRIPRGFVVLTVLTFFIAGISTFLVFLISRLISELYKLSKNIPNLRDYAYGLLAEGQVWYANLSPEILERIQETTSNIGSGLTKIITSMINSLIDFFTSLFTSLPSMFMILLITIIATYFFTKDRENLQNALINSLPERWRTKTRSVYMDLTGALAGYFRAQFTLISLTTIISITGFYILGLDYALTMGLLSGLFDVLPIFGPGAVYVPWIIWLLFSGKVRLALSLIALYVIIIVVRQIMEPKLVAENIGAHPLATLAAIFIGLQTLGIIGIFIGPAVLVIAQAVKKARTL